MKNINIYGISSGTEENLTFIDDTTDLVDRLLFGVILSIFSSTCFNNVKIFSMACPISPSVPSTRCIRARTVNFARSSIVAGACLPIVCSSLDQ